MPPIQNTYDLYNQTFTVDKPIADAVIAEIYDLLATNIAANINTFDYLLTPLLGSLPMLQSNRIVDRVLCVLRDGGLRCKVKNVGVGPGPDTNLSTPYYSPWFNNVTAMLDTITITWFSRSSQEYLKTYC